MLAVTAQRKAGGRHRLDCTQPVTFYAGNLNQPPSRIAGHAQVVFQGYLGRVFNLFVRAAKRGANPPLRNHAKLFRGR